MLSYVLFIQFLHESLHIKFLSILCEQIDPTSLDLCWGPPKRHWGPHLSPSVGSKGKSSRISFIIHLKGVILKSTSPMLRYLCPMWINTWLCLFTDIQRLSVGYWNFFSYGDFSKFLSFWWLAAKDSLSVTSWRLSGVAAIPPWSK